MDKQPDHPTLPSFDDFSFDQRLYQAISKRGFTVPTPVQTSVLPLAATGRDLWVCAKTGSGKTAAFLLPIVQHILTDPRENPVTAALILAPTRELAGQIHKQCQQLAEFTPIKTGLIIGGDDFKKQATALSKQVDILIATPGRLIEHIGAGETTFDQLKFLVIDEADRMLDMGFRGDLLTIAERCPAARQTLLFSATLDPTIQGVAHTLLNDPERVYLDGIQAQHADIDQQMLLADDFEHKQKLLSWLLTHESYEKALVFTNTKHHADRLRGPLRGQKLRVASLHGDMDQSERTRTMYLFQEGTIDILIATDVAARGLDIEGIDLVINFDLARNGHDYVHRIGRTGRAGRQGTAIALVNPTEWNILAGIERYLRQRLTRRRIKELTGRYQGPKKLKSSGKAAGSKRKKDERKKDKSTIKQRHRDRKNIGKRRQPSVKTTTT